MKRLLLLLLFVATSMSTAQAASPAEMISAFRGEHGEGPVVADATLTRIARDQANAMAAKDDLDHDVLGAFSNRIAPAGASYAAENIAYGYDDFPKTLNQWIESSGHRANLLMHNATRVGVASAKSTTSGRTYWSMAIAGGYEPPKVVASAKPTHVTKLATTAAPKSKAEPSTACHIKILRLCL
jgi:uncharacterized protein YkwD